MSNNHEIAKKHIVGHKMFLDDNVTAHNASQVKIIDLADYYNSTEVESALAEIGKVYVASHESTGFPDTTRYSDSTLSFVDGNRTFSITPTGASFNFFENNKEYTKTSADSIVIADTEGVHYIYYDDGTLTESVNPSDSTVGTVIRTKPIVCILLWDATNNTAIWVAEERHGVQMDGNTHAYLHFKNGLVWTFGLSLSGFSIDGNGSLDAHAQFGVDLGSAYDEDISHEVSAISSTTGLPIYYLENGAGNWRKQTNAGFSILTTGTGRAAWNEWTGAVWQISEVPNNQFVLYHIFMTAEKDNPMLCVMGQNTYATLTLAREGASVELGSLNMGYAPTPESTPIGTIIVKTKTVFANAVKSIFVSNIDGDNYTDFRKSTITRTTGPSSHPSLSDLSYETASHTGFGRLSYSTNSDPGVNNDDVDTASIGRFFRIGDFWINTTTDTFFVCVDNTTGAAVWRDIVYENDSPKFAKIDVYHGNIGNSRLNLGGGDLTFFTNATVELGYASNGTQPHFIHTRHGNAVPANNFIDFYTSDGTAQGVFPTNAVHGITISNGRLGVNQLNPSVTLDVGGAGKFDGALNMNTHLINNVVNPVSAQDAATKNYVDDNFVQNIHEIDVGSGDKWYKIGQLSGNGSRVTVRVHGGFGYSYAEYNGITTAQFSIGAVDDRFGGFYYNIGEKNPAHTFEWVKTGTNNIDCYVKLKSYFRGSVEIVEGFTFTLDSAFPTAVSDPSGTDLTSELRIHNTLFKPVQPMISGRVGSTNLTTVAASYLIPFDDFFVSRGITYNSGTRRFTVPVDGVYRVTFDAFFLTGYGAARVIFGVNTDVPTNSSNVGHIYRQDTGYDTCSCTVLLDLSANDYIVFRLLSGRLYNQINDRFNTFSIELVG